jgi:hypothetical protein
MNTEGLDVNRIKQNVLEYWNAESWNWPVKVMSAQRASALGASTGHAVAVKGFVTSEKFVRGRSLEQVERTLGLKRGELKDGAVLLRLSTLPLPHQYELGGYTQTPAGEPYSGGSYPPGLGASQWNLTVEMPATVLRTARAGGRL